MIFPINTPSCSNIVLVTCRASLFGFRLILLPNNSREESVRIIPALNSTNRLTASVENLNSPQHKTQITSSFLASTTLVTNFPTLFTIWSRSSSRRQKTILPVWATFWRRGQQSPPSPNFYRAASTRKHLYTKRRSTSWMHHKYQLIIA